MKEFTVSASDLTDDMKLTCTLTGTSPDYGSVYVDENMNLIHAPAEADANDTLHLENCILSVETPNNEYPLNGNVLSVIRNRLNGSVTAEAWVYTAAPEKLVEFEYNSAGLRVQKKMTVYGETITTNYSLCGKHLISMEQNDQHLEFLYRDEDCPQYIYCNGSIYTYIYNLQNDVVGIRDSFGNIVVEYNYDAWGRIIQISGSMANTLGTINPFRYRRYLFDHEEDLYYIETRYYLPQNNRFATPDLTMCGRSGYVYCYNEIVKYFAPNGAEPECCDGVAVSMDVYVLSGLPSNIFSRWITGTYGDQDSKTMEEEIIDMINDRGWSIVNGMIIDAATKSHPITGIFLQDLIEMSGEYREIVEGREFDVLESFAGNYADGRSNYMHDGYAYTEFIFSMADLIVEL